MSLVNGLHALLESFIFHWHTIIVNGIDLYLRFCLTFVDWNEFISTQCSVSRSDNVFMFDRWRKCWFVMAASAAFVSVTDWITVYVIAISSACLAVSSELLLTWMLARFSHAPRLWLRLLYFLFFRLHGQSSLWKWFFFHGKFFDYIWEFANFLGLLITRWKSLFGS